MIETSGRILKRDDVEMDGQYQLDLEPGRFETPQPTLTNTAASEPQARIIENQPGYAVIEMICSCGAKVCLKCEYTNDEVLESS